MRLAFLTVTRRRVVKSEVSVTLMLSVSISTLLNGKGCRGWDCMYVL